MGKNNQKDANTPSIMSESAEHTDIMVIKAELILSIKTEISSLFQTELKHVLSNKFDWSKMNYQQLNLR